MVISGKQSISQSIQDPKYENEMNEVRNILTQILRNSNPLADESDFMEIVPAHMDTKDWIYDSSRTFKTKKPVRYLQPITRSITQQLTQKDVKLIAANGTEMGKREFESSGPITPNKKNRY